jgi:hypothetical protein
MTLFVCWVVFPLVMTLLALGCGLLAETVAGIRLPGPLIPGVGLAVIIVATHFTTLSDATAELSIPVVVALAVAGIALSIPWRKGRLDWWAVGTAVAAFALYAAPVVLSGEATFTGYIKLDDTATWLAITDRVMEHGRDLTGLAPSSYEATLAVNLPGGYPIGAFLPLGVGQAIVSQDGAWVIQPYMAFLAAMLATTFYMLAAPVLRSQPLRALAAFVAAQAALLFAYYLWGGVKEIAAAWAIALIAALAVPATRPGTPMRAVIPLAFAGAATLAILSFGGAVWLGPLLLAAAVLAVRSYGARFTAQRAAAFLVAGAVLALPSLLKAKTFLSPNSGTLTNSTDLGNLIKPLSGLQFFGIWPNGDFRLRPESMAATRLLIAVVIVAALAGLWLAWRRGGNALLIYVAGATVGCVLVTSFASPWVDAKALATASPAFVLAGLIAAGAIVESGRRLEGALVIAAIAGGVLWSNALAYQDANLAPRGRLAELEQIGEKYAGQGPALMTEYEPYGVRHFLRKLDAEGASELRRRVIPLRSGRALDKLEVADIDQFALDGLLVYKTLVLRTSPVESRPPSPYTLVEHGRWYDVWQRPDGPSAVVDHLPLGDALHPSAPVRCSAIERLAREAGPKGRLAVAIRGADPIVIELSSATRPSSWQPSTEATGSVFPAKPGIVETFVHAPTPGAYGVWVGGGFRRELELLVDGRRVSAHRDELSHAGQYEPLADVQLTPGVHRISLRYGKSDLRPGSGEPPFSLGPLVLSPRASPTVRYVDARNAQSLCGGTFDWVEAIS